MSLHQDPTQTAVRRQKRSLWTDAWRRMRRSHTAVIGMILFALIVIVCFSAPLFSDYDAQVINSDIALIRKYPVEGHPLGTDELGRDLLLRILWGGRTSITIAWPRRSFPPCLALFWVRSPLITAARRTASSCAHWTCSWRSRPCCS